MAMIEAFGWGVLGASALALGALLAIVRPWSARLVGLDLGFGAGALISAVSFDLALRGLRAGGLVAVAIGLAAGALTFFVLDGMLDRLANRLRQGEKPTAQRAGRRRTVLRLVRAGRS
jgi:zinc transporter, ZIP family